MKFCSEKNENVVISSRFFLKIQRQAFQLRRFFYRTKIEVVLGIFVLENRVQSNQTSFSLSKSILTSTFVISLLFLCCSIRIETLKLNEQTLKTEFDPLRRKSRLNSSRFAFFLKENRNSIRLFFQEFAE